MSYEYLDYILFSAAFIFFLLFVLLFFILQVYDELKILRVNNGKSNRDIGRTLSASSTNIKESESDAVRSLAVDSILNYELKRVGAIHTSSIDLVSSTGDSGKISDTSSDIEDSTGDIGNSVDGDEPTGFIDDTINSEGTSTGDLTEDGATGFLDMNQGFDKSGYDTGNVVILREITNLG